MTLKESMYLALGTLKGLYAGCDEEGKYHVKDSIRELEDRLEELNKPEPMTDEERKSFCKWVLGKIKENN